MSEDEAELVPPSADRVARRALVLATVVCRSGLEGDAGNSDAEAFRKDIVTWTERLGLTGEFEPDEMSILAAPLGTLTQRQLIDATWRTEGLAVLAWALEHYELPEYDVQADGPAAAFALGFRKDRSSTVLYEPRLKPKSAISELADRMFALHFRQFSLDGASVDFGAFARRAWFGPLNIEGFRLLNGDLELGGIPIGCAPETVWRTAMSIARERQQAANWLEGQDQVFSEVTCDT